MHILRHLYLNSVVRSPDDPVIDPAAALIDPPASDPPAADPPAADPPAADPPAAEIVDPPAADPPPAPAPKAPAMVPIRVLHERVGKVERRATQAEQRAADLQAILDRMQQQPPPAAGDPPAPAARQPAASAAPSPTEDAIQAEVNRREANNSIGALVAAGRRDFAADWNEKADILGAVGAADPEFVLDVIAVDPVNGHKIIYALAQDPERAAELATMDVRRRTIELTRMRMAEEAKITTPAAEPAKPAAPPVSRAPAPKPAIAPRAAAPDIDPTTPEGNEKMSDKEWERWYKNKYEKRA